MNIVIQGGNYYFYNFTEIVKTLPSKIFKLKFNEVSQTFYLTEDTEFAIPSKIYGSLNEDAERYLRSFQRPGNLGILLIGEKGSGKTLLSRLIGVKSNLPVILIEDRFENSEFVSFLNSIQQECVVVFDEFDKVYKESYDQDGNATTSQTAILKLLDGGHVSKKLFIFTCNEDELSTYMVNRPSRIRYKQSFSKMGEKDLIEVLNDKLENKDYIPDFVEVFQKYKGFNLDTILVVCDECNFTKQPPSTVIKTMNIVYQQSVFEIILTYKNRILRSYSTFRGEIDKLYDRNMLNFFDLDHLKLNENLYSQISAELRSINQKNWKYTLQKDGSLLLQNVKFSELQLLFEPIVFSNHVF